MIIEALVKMLAALLTGIASLFGTITMPGWWSSVDAWLATLSAAGAGMGNWIPWTVALGAVGFVMTCMTLSFAIRLVRIGVSLFTGGGGSAA